LGRRALKIARRMDKPVTAGFHVQAQNVTAHFLWWIHDPLINKMVYWNFYNHFYRYVDAIHYPSAFIKALFEKETGKRRRAMSFPTASKRRSTMIPGGSRSEI
jgi:hypothetical protein